MTYSEWRAPFTGLRSLFSVLDSKGGYPDKTEMSSHTWANWREKKQNVCIPVNKESIRTHSLFQEGIFIKVKPHVIKIWTLLVASI